jgi:diaminohydroxyphosphoribosylaminopyrimidine deaminase/5-amino-6-(5-phosphoribosylamino)uracil reductase
VTARGAASARARSARETSAPSARISADDERFMRRALALAEKGRGTTRPNPVVGAVVVRRGRVVGEGFHVRAGEPHAEVHALRAAGEQARGATLYVTLEPCCHVGRTGPCTAAVRAAGVARVVAGCRDPNPVVDGKGVAELRRAGVRVDVGCLESDCEAAIAGYATWIRARRPLVTLKVAATLDGFIAPARRRARRAPVWLTGPAARHAAHELRAAHDAVLVGSGTVRADDPRLTVRLSGRRAAPLRVVLAGRRALPRRAHINDDAAPTLVISGRVPIRRALATLAARGIQSVLVEGGATIHAAFIAAGLVDRVALFVAPRLLGGGTPIAAGGGLPIARALALGPLTARAVGDDLLITADVVGRHRS